MRGAMARVAGWQAGRPVHDTSVQSSACSPRPALRCCPRNKSTPIMTLAGRWLGLSGVRCDVIDVILQGCSTLHTSSVLASRASVSSARYDNTMESSIHSAGGNSVQAAGTPGPREDMLVASGSQIAITRFLSESDRGFGS